MKNMRPAFSLQSVNRSVFFDETLRSPWFWFIAAGYMLRIFFMPLTGQHDVMFMPWMTHFINQGHFNLYAFLFDKFGDIVMHRPGVWAPYPYGFYAFTAGWLEFLDRIGAWNLDNWDSIWVVLNPARSVFLLKAAYLPFDLMIGFVLFRVGGRLGLALWAWSATAIYTPFMMGQNDIYATAFATIGIYAAARSIQIADSRHTLSQSFSNRLLLNKWAILASILLGLGATFKIYPLLLLLPLVLVMTKQLRARLLLLCIGLLFFVISVLPFVTTPVFMNGVLLNPEGAKIMQEIQLFGVSVSPFFIGYLLLIGMILVVDAPHNPPYLVWFIGAAVMALLFLWAPTPFYWLIWITPLLIGVVNRARGLLYAWFALQSFFALTILVEHRELGVALPIHLYDGFNVPNLPTALAITHPVLARLFSDGWGIVNALFVTALLAVLWYSFTAVVKKHHLFIYGPKVLWGIAAPVMIMLMGLTANLYASKDLVSQNNWYEWQSQTFAAGDQVVQELSLGSGELTGVRLRFEEASPASVLTLCIYPDGDLEQEPIACASRTMADQVENQILYFEFDDTVLVRTQHHPMVSIRVDGPDASITLPYATVSEERLLFFGEAALNGSLDVSALTSFSVRKAFEELIVNNILHDRYLLLSIGLVTGLTLLVIAVIFRKP